MIAFILFMWVSNTELVTVPAISTEQACHELAAKTATVFTVKANGWTKEWTPHRHTCVPYEVAK